MSKINSSRFLLQWVTAVTITMIVATMAAFASMWTIGEAISHNWGEIAGGAVAGFVFGALLAIGLGSGQAILLREQGIRFNQWLGRTALAGAAGMAVGFTTTFALFDLDNVPQTVAGALIALSAGLPIGLVQWRMLKSQVPQAQLWPLICVAAFLIAFMVGLPLGGEGRELLSVGTVALLMAVITGAGFVWLARASDAAVTAGTMLEKFRCRGLRAPDEQVWSTPDDALTSGSREPDKVLRSIK